MSAPLSWWDISELDNLLQIDGNLNLTFKNAYSIGLSYRNKDALSFMGGVNLGTTTVGYAYDLGISKIKTYNDGTHEVFMSFKLKKNNQSKTPWKNRNRVYSNSSSSTNILFLEENVYVSKLKLRHFLKFYN